jgi:hypothetical protein
MRDPEIDPELVFDHTYKMPVPKFNPSILSTNGLPNVHRSTDVDVPLLSPGYMIHLGFNRNVMNTSLLKWAWHTLKDPD